jgi:HlyD family secretion protein
VRLVEPSGFTKISALGVEEQRVRVLIDITTPPAQWRALGDGFRVGVRILTLAVDDALLAPLGAVFPLPGGNQGSAVFVIDQGRAKRVSVDVGARNGSVAWIRSGLTAGTPVIVYPPADVVDGKRVRERRA